MSFLAPLALALAALGLPILILYMLKLRREEQVVSSTMLWQQVLRDQQANAPWQRLRRNLLLLLQLLLLFLLVMALAGVTGAVLVRPLLPTGQEVLVEGQVAPKDVRAPRSIEACPPPSRNPDNNEVHGLDRQERVNLIHLLY